MICGIMSQPMSGKLKKKKKTNKKKQKIGSSENHYLVTCHQNSSVPEMSEDVFQTSLSPRSLLNVDMEKRKELMEVGYWASTRACVWPLGNLRKFDLGLQGHAASTTLLITRLLMRWQRWPIGLLPRGWLCKMHLGFIRQHMLALVFKMCFQSFNNFKAWKWEI